METPDLLERLNEEQKKAVTHKNGPLLIVAGAGTGKTTVITRRIAWLIAEKHAKADEILALTFTDKAAGEMEERVDQLLPYGYVDLWISTFHAFCERVLRDYALDIGVPTDFKMMNDIEAQLLVRKHMDQFDLDYYQPRGNPTKFLSALLRHFSRAKDEDITPLQYVEFAQNAALDTDKSDHGTTTRKNRSRANVEEINEAERLAEVANAYATYERLLRENSAVDFGDLITLTIKLLRERPSVRKKFQQQFKYILVDEFQDTNTAQYDLLKLLVNDEQNITVVGDDDQSIYRFRGASISNILTFKKEFANSTDVVLTQNYRSAQEILDTSYDFIQLNNPDRLEAQMNGDSALAETISKKLTAQSKDAEIKHLHVPTVEDEGIMVAKTILDVKDRQEDLAWKDFAILVRANDHAENFMSALDRAGIPYHFLASKGLFFRAEIVDVLSYLRLLDNYHEARAVWRVLNFPQWRLTPRDQSQLMQFITRKAASAFDAVLNARTVPGLSEEAAKTCARVSAFVEKHARAAQSTKPSQLILTILQDTGYFEYLSKFSQESELKAREQLQNIESLLKIASQFEQSTDDPSLNAFISEIDITLASGESGDLPQSTQDTPDAVNVMTVHAAKGLEFEHVFIGNLVDKRFPSIGRKDPIELPDALLKEILPEGDFHLQEERRLFYVAMTRAKSGLYFVSAEDYGGARKKKLSRFLLEANIATDKELAPTPTGEVRFASEKPEESTEQKLPLPKTLSFTQIKAFETCPYQYRFAHLLKVPVPGRATFSFGKTIHAALQEFFKRVQSRQGAQQQGLFGASEQQSTEPPSLNELLEIYEDRWIDDWYESAAQKKEYKENGRRILKEFYNSHNGTFPTPTYLEKGFVLRVGDYGVRGFIDRVDPEGDGLEIIDYKTGNPPKDNKRVDKDQLQLYAIAAEDVLKEKPVKLTFWYLENNTKITFEPDREAQTKLQEKIQRTAKKIEQSDFKATPGMQCQYCDFKNICDFRAK